MRIRILIGTTVVRIATVIAIGILHFLPLIDDNGYPHDGRADKNPYLHDRRADKDSYPHNSNNQYIILRLQLSFAMINVQLMLV